MRIGIDFDNTIVNYDHVFHQVAYENGYIEVTFPINKLEIRNYLRKEGKEREWTYMQGYVYGQRMNDAIPYNGVIDFFTKALDRGCCIAIISHKTQYPYLGPLYDLHKAARDWINQVLVQDGKILISDEQLFFKQTKQEKVRCIEEWDCDYFIDDLPEIFSDTSFPPKTKRVLFDPENKHESLLKQYERICHSWLDIKKWIGPN